MAKQNSLNTEEIFKGIKKDFWQRLAENIKIMIRNDMIAGEVQEYTEQKKKTSGGARNYSAGYKKYKANYMNRFTDGKKLKSVSGKSVVDSKTDSVNMRLTGQTIAGLHLEQVLTNGIIMSYQESDAKKIEGNADMGRIITTLNEKNREKTLKLYSEALDRSLREWAKKELVIRVGN